MNTILPLFPKVHNFVDHKVVNFRGCCCNVLRYCNYHSFIEWVEEVADNVVLNPQKVVRDLVSKQAYLRVQSLVFSE